MTPQEAIAAVNTREDVILYTAQGAVHAKGKIISYSIVPTVTIETVDGERISWRHDMTELDY